MDNLERQVKGIWFPIEIWEADDLDWNEKILLLEIDSFTSKGLECYMSNEYIAGFLKVSEWKAGQMVNDLISKGYVIKTRFDGRKRFIESNLISSLLKKQEQPFEKQKADFGKSQANYNKINNDSTNHQYNKKGVRFIPPTFTEVQSYCSERRNNVNADAFIAYYESNGWMVGKNRMKDWKAAVRTWEQRDSAKPQARPVRQEKKSNLERINEMMAQVMGGFADDQ